MHSVLKRLSRSIQVHGPMKASLNAGRYLVDVARDRLEPSRRRERESEARREAEFDERHNIDTRGYVYLADLEVESENWKLGAPYIPTDPVEFRDVLAAAQHQGVDLRQRTFIDFGCGKGRALFLAADHPFRRIVGVEFSPELCKVAERNVHTFVSNNQQCDQFDVVCADVLEYELPDEPLFCFFYNPFTPPLFEKVIAKFTAAVENRTQPLFIAYLRPDCAAMWDASPSFEKVVETDRHAMWRSKSPK